MNPHAVRAYAWLTIAILFALCALTERWIEREAPPTGTSLVFVGMIAFAVFAAILADRAERKPRA